MRSPVAPVRAEIGFMVMLPQSLNQISRWMRSEVSTWKPARASRSPTCCRRALVPPAGSPRINRLPKAWVTTPGAAVPALRCTTQPSTRSVGMWARIRSPGSTVASRRPWAGPSRWSKNHQGMPFIATSTVVWAPLSACTAGATAPSAGPLTATTTRSCTPRASG